MPSESSRRKQSNTKVKGGLRILVIFESTSIDVEHPHRRMKEPLGIGYIYMNIDRRARGRQFYHRPRRLTLDPSAIATHMCQERRGRMFRRCRHNLVLCNNSCQGPEPRKQGASIETSSRTLSLSCPHLIVVPRITPYMTSFQSRIQ